jgi:hypothetical protein
MSVFISCSTRILIILVCSLLSDCRVLRESNKKQPHIILIVADDLVSSPCNIGILLLFIIMYNINTDIIPIKANVGS